MNIRIHIASNQTTFVFCIPEELGDGICQDHNNGPYCDNDLGDCCLVQQAVYEECCNCGCVFSQFDYLAK